MDPIILPSNQPPEMFYKGGPQIGHFRGEPSEGLRSPEDWIASTTCCRGQSSLGLTLLPSGILLRDEIKNHPNEWLGSDHIKAFGVDTKLLVKLIDAGQRLPVHAHPHAKWAKANVGASHGKSEAWYILKPGHVYLGLQRDISQEELLALVQAQDIDKLLPLLHRVQVKPHQTVYVPAGTLHAIEEGMLVAEIQEPEDMSILLEWKGFAIDGVQEGHLGLGFEVALGAVDKTARKKQEINSLISSEGSFGSVLVKDAGEYFVLERLRVEGKEKCKAGFSILILLDGTVEVISENGKPITLGGKGATTAVVPFAAGSLKLHGKGEVLVARPPLVE